MLRVNCDLDQMKDSPGKRLLSFRETLEFSQEELADSLGVSRATVGLIETDVRAPSRSFLQKISEVYNISADWLLHGRGEMLHASLPGFPTRRRGRIEPPDYDHPVYGDFAYDGDEFVMIERFDLSVSAGTGLEAVEGSGRDRLAFSRAWLSSHGISSDLAVLVRVRGDSMAPTIADGALVLVHVIENYVTREGIYAFNRQGASYIKRLVPAGVSGSGRPTAIVIIADNPAYPPESVSGPQLNELRVIGRVRCALVEF